MALRFYTENEGQRKWKTSIKVNRRHVSKMVQLVEKLAVGAVGGPKRTKTPRNRGQTTTRVEF